MGNVLSSASSRERAVDNVTTSESETMGDTSVLCDDSKADNSNEEVKDAGSENESRTKTKEEEMVEFRKELTIKREQRREILARHRTEKEELEKSLQTERESKLELYENNKLLRDLLLQNNIEIPENLQASNASIAEQIDVVNKMKEDFENLRSSNMKLRRDLSDTNSALQEANSDIADLNSQNRESMKQINALKDVVAVSKTMVNLREQQLNDLKNKLNEIERTLADRETNLLSADLRQEYERQLQNIRTLRGLYEERARLAEVTRQGLVKELDEHKVLYETEVKKSKDLASRIEELEDKVDSLLETIDNKNIEISTCQDETNVLKAEMAVVNKLFSQVLLGYKTKQDLDKLVHRLEENHGLLTQMAEKENGSEASSALPKLLLELVSQVEENEEKDKKSNDDEESVLEEGCSEQMDKYQNPPNTTAEEIVENLPKVWKVLIELLSHQSAPEENSTEEKVTTCYKSVETKSGPVLVPSVSQTYIRLKDLIVEKLGLIKEVNRMKQLNTHLETRLGEQERRLCLVTNELSKTWHVVGRLRRHHHQLHTHEKILKYELQQKRKLLNELKEELEYCREKWEQAREKNTQSERDWRKLRAEFSSRKTKAGSPSFNNSGESGYSDERQSDESSESNDESEYVAIRCKKKIKKSFETILDSSTDFNLAAEREDPASDMLDVAELPLDAQENEENRDDTSKPGKSDHIRVNNKSCEETEDEIGDITHDDSCTEESCTEQIFTASNENTSEVINNVPNENVAQAVTSSSVSVIDTNEVVNSTQQEHERVAKKEYALKNTETGSASLLQTHHSFSTPSNQIYNTLDHDILINQPATSGNKVNNTTNENNSGISSTPLNNVEQSCNDITICDTPKQPEKLSQIAQALIQRNTNHISDFEPTSDTESTRSEFSIDDNERQNGMPDFKAILENVRKQKERLAKRDERLHKIETGCTEVVDNLTSTLETGTLMINKLDALHKEQQSQSDESATEHDSNELSKIEHDEAIPSSSHEVDHEARFAARDLRLKRLEEQTKSLVNKVNKTTSKGIKINYKLEELHNIYGSENSRAGTPSEEHDEKNNDDEVNED